MDTRDDIEDLDPCEVEYRLGYDAGRRYEALRAARQEAADAAVIAELTKTPDPAHSWEVGVYRAASRAVCRVLLEPWEFPSMRRDLEERHREEWEDLWDALDGLLSVHGAVETVRRNLPPVSVAPDPDVDAPPPNEDGYVDRCDLGTEWCIMAVAHARDECSVF